MNQADSQAPPDAMVGDKSILERIWAKSLVRYCAVGGATFVANLGLLYAFHEWAKLSTSTAYACAVATIFVVNFYVARHLIFRSRASSPGRQALRYVLTSLVIRSLEWATFTALDARLDTWYMQLAATVQVGFFFAKFFFYRATVFRPDPDAQ